MAEDILDCTQDPESGIGAGFANIRLRTGIDLNDLRSKDGIMLEPDIDESLFENKPHLEDKSYFCVTDPDEFDKLLQKVKEDREIDDDPDENQTLGDFEKKLQKMTPIKVMFDETEHTIEGIHKRIKKHGLQSLGLVPPNASVTIHYSLYLEENDEPYDSTRLRNKAEKYRLDDGRLFPGFELCIKSMLKGEKSEFIIQPEHAFGKMGCPPRIPGSAQILAVIELLDVSREVEAENLVSMLSEERTKAKTFAEILQVAKNENLEGNDYVRGGNWELAIPRYERGIKLLDEVVMNNEEEQKAMEDTLIKLLLNCALCHLKKMKPQRVCFLMKRVLEKDPKNAKACFRMAKGKELLGRKQEAMNYFRRAERINPDNVDIGKEILRLQQKIIRERDMEKDFCRRMFAEGKETSDQKDEKEHVDDEFYSDFNKQMEAFVEDEHDNELTLPKSFDISKIQVAMRIAQRWNLTVEEKNIGNLTYWAVVKPFGYTRPRHRSELA